MEIKLIRWACEGFRCPDMNINLAVDGDVPRVSLIQMPNGTGKTTTLHLLKATLTGDARNWTPQQIAELRHPVGGCDEGKFTVELRIDGKPLTIELHCDFESSVASFSTISPEMGGFNNDWTPPPGVRRFLTRRFVDLFVFDGELANSLLDSTKTKAEDAIETLCQLNLLDSITDDCESFWKLSTANVGARNERGLSRYRTIASKLSDHLIMLRRRAQQNETKLDEVQRSISTLKSNIQRLVEENGNAREKWHSRRSEKVEKEEALAGALREMMEKMRRPEALAPEFGKVLQSVKSNLDLTKLPDSTSRQFFVELAQEAECICGRPIGEEHRHNILNRAEHFLGEDLAGVLNALKQEVDLLDPLERKTALDAKVAQIQQLRSEIANLDADIALIEKTSVSAAGQDPEVFRLQLRPLQDEEQTLSNEIKILRGPLGPGNSELITSVADIPGMVVIAVVEKQLKLANDEINRINGTLELRSRLDLLKMICADARLIAKEKIKKIVIERCNARLLSVLKGDPLQIAHIEKSIVLQGRDSGSTGQNLAVGYTFLAQALSKGAHDFPLVVDSPAGPLDHSVRREIAAMVPGLCKQFVAFTISTEREAFMEPLEQSAGGDVRYITVFRKSPGNDFLMRELPSHHVDNGSSVMVIGRDYFERFALVDEREGV